MVISSCRSLVQVRVLYYGYIILPLPRPSESFILYVVISSCRSLVQVRVIITWLYLSCRSLVPDESFIRGYIILPLPRPSESFTTWLYHRCRSLRPSESFIRGYSHLAQLPRPSESQLPYYYVVISSCTLPRPSDEFYTWLYHLAASLVQP